MAEIHYACIEVGLVKLVKFVVFRDSVFLGPSLQLVTSMLTIPNASLQKIIALSLAQQGPADLRSWPDVCVNEDASLSGAPALGCETVGIVSCRVSISRAAGRIETGRRAELWEQGRGSSTIKLGNRRSLFKALHLRRTKRSCARCSYTREG